MGIITVTDEYTSPIPPSRIFKSLILDADNLVPELFPQIIKNIEIIQGDGGPGTIKQMNFAEGDALADKLEKICYEAELESSPEGGTISKVASKYYSLRVLQFLKRKSRLGKKWHKEFTKAVEAYLLQNPDAYV